MHADLPLSSSTSMQPTLQMSHGKDQPSPRITSGALHSGGRDEGTGGRFVSAGQDHTAPHATLAICNRDIAWTQWFNGRR